LRFGGAMFVLATTHWFLSKPIFPRRPIDYGVEVIIGVLCWPVTGYIWGCTMWNFYETYFGEPRENVQ
jgi:hypothetical protein